MPDRILMIYLEPAPYIVAFVREVRSQWPGQIDVIYTTMSGSQPWDVSLEDEGAILLSNSGSSSFASIIEYIKHGNYKVIHLAGWGGRVFQAALVYGFLKRIPLVLESDTRSFPENVRNVISGYKERQSPYSSLSRRIIKSIVYPILFTIPAFFLPAGSKQKEYLRKFLVSDNKIRIGKMSVDVNKISEFCERYRGNIISQHEPDIERQRRVVFLYVGRLEPYKGIAELISAFSALAAERSDVDLLMAGDGSMRRYVEDAAARCPSIKYSGRLDGDRLRECYAKADVLVLPSHLENWGLVVNEAMAASLPVIVSDAVGCAEDLVRHDITGLIVKPGSKESLIAAMRKLANDPEGRKRMGLRARLLISEWTLTEQAQVAIAVWQEALS